MSENDGPVQGQRRQQVENTLPGGERRGVQGKDERGPAERDAEEKIRPVNPGIGGVQALDEFPCFIQGELAALMS